MVSYNFNGTVVNVEPGQRVFVVTDQFASSVSVLTREPKRIEGEIERGIWEEAFVYSVSDTGVKLLNQPVGGES